MKIKVVGSSSAGNCYILEGSKASLIIEAGLPFKKVLPLIDFKISNIDGCLLSHSHGDHCNHINSILSYSIPAYASLETILEISKGSRAHHNFRSVDNLVKFKVGEFTVLPFELKHDVKCFGYLIKHEEMGTMLFATDTYYLPYKFKGLNHIMIEANYEKSILDENIMAGTIHPVVKKRVLQSHMEIKTVEAMLAANDLTKVKNIILIHLSSGNADATNFRQRIVRQTGIPTHIAKKGLEINLNNF